MAESHPESLKLFDWNRNCTLLLSENGYEIAPGQMQNIARCLAVIYLSRPIVPSQLLDYRTLTASKTRYLRIAVITLLMAVLYGNILVEMARDWWNVPSFSQGLLMPPLALLAAWLLRDTTFREPVLPSSAGYWVTGFACVLLIVGRLAAEFFVQRISFVVLLAGLVLTFWGKARLRSLAFPLLLLSTMVPLPLVVYTSFAGPLQLLASSVATDVARYFGVAVYQDGNVIHLAGISLGVEEACSGLSSISALAVTSLLLGFVFRAGVLERGILFALAIPVAIAVNIIRVAGSAILADYDQKFAYGFYHSFSGWLVFVVGALTLATMMKILHLLLVRELK